MQMHSIGVYQFNNIVIVISNLFLYIHFIIMKKYRMK